MRYIGEDPDEWRVRQAWRHGFSTGITMMLSGLLVVAAIVVQVLAHH